MALDWNRMGLAIGVGVTTAVVSIAGGYTARAQPAKTVWDGVYTMDQAARGEASYQKECATCHGAALEGEAFAPALIAEGFTARWEDSTVADVLMVVKTSMPADRPGMLGADAYADIVAYLLKMNKYPAGQKELSKDPTDAKEYFFTKAAPAR